MASLQNCLPVTPYTAQELPGDDVNALELSAPPTGGNSQAGIFWLTIEAMPGYWLTANMINIGDVSGNTLAEDGEGNGSIFSWTTDSEAAIAAVLPTNVDSVTVVNSTNNAYENCDNKVYVAVKIVDEFVMPNSNYTISIDFGGTAIECPPAPISNVIDIDYQLYITNYGNSDEYNLFVAQYYESESYASSIYNWNNAVALYAGYWPVYNYTSNNLDASEYSWIWEGWASNNTCFSSYQPTCFSRWGDQLNALGWTEPGGFVAFNDGTANVPLSTLCNQIHINAGVMNPQSEIGVQDYTNYNFDNVHPNLTTGIVSADMAPRTRYKWRIKSSNENDQNLYNVPYLDPVTYPVLEPGDGILPSELCWYISVGDDPDWELDVEGVSIFSIVSGKHIGEVTADSTLGDNATTCSFADDGSVTTNGAPVAEWYGQTNTSGTNNSDLSLVSEGFSITQVDSKTVKIKIPFNSNVIIDRFNDPQFRRTKIFLDVVPTWLGM